MMNMMTSESTGLSILEKIASMKEPALSAEQIAQRYGEWAQDGKYDKDFSVIVYSFPSLAAAAVAEHLQGRRDVCILDVGAGTGMVAIQLRELGFTLIDALDGSEGMLGVAQGKDLYRQYFHALFEGKVDCIKTSSYDVLVCCGAMGQHLVQWYMLGEMVRCVKPGGLIVILVLESTLKAAEGFKDQFEPYVKRLESEGQWVLLERTTVPQFIDEMGVKLVFKVTKSEL